MNTVQTRQILASKPKKLRINIIGVGKVATTMAVLWHRSNQVHIQSVWNRSISASRQLQHLLPHIEIISDLNDMPPAEIIVFGLRDQILTIMAEKVSRMQWMTPDTILIHFSGALASSVLMPDKKKALTGSMHPVFAFSDIDTAISTLPGHLCAIEAAEAVQPVLQILAQSAGLETFIVSSEQKARYHAALSASANFLVALNHYARSMLESISIPDNLADRLVNQLMLQNLNQLQQFSPAEALTGPISRGDMHTISKHWHSLTTQEQNLYQALAIQTLKLTTLSQAEQTQIKKIINYSQDEIANE